MCHVLHAIAIEEQVYIPFVCQTVDKEMCMIIHNGMSYVLGQLDPRDA